MKLKNVFLCILFALIALPAGAAELKGVQMQDDLQVAGKKLELNGMGVRSVSFIKIGVYVGALYLEKKSSSPEEIIGSKQLKKTILAFLRDVSSKQVRDAWKEGFKKNCTGAKEECEPFQAELAKLKVPDIKKGQRLEFVFHPEKVEITFPGNKTETVQGAAFARTMLSTWLGKEPPNEALKDGMLGKE